MHVGQADIFDAAVRPIVDASMCGYNGTVFAYGQTGAGKTYFDRRPAVQRAWHNPSHNRARFPLAQSDSSLRLLCRDLPRVVLRLLDHSHSATPIEEWKRVLAMQNGHGEVQMQGLGVYETETEKDAMNLLFTGNIHRMTSETPMNQASSRSHCIFTLSIESHGSEGGAGGAGDDGGDSGESIGKQVVYRSKLHLVDLAGSERQMSMRRHRRAAHRFASTGRMVGRSLIHGGGGGAGELTPTSPSSPHVTRSVAAAATAASIILSTRSKSKKVKPSTSHSTTWSMSLFACKSVPRVRLSFLVQAVNTSRRGGTTCTYLIGTLF